MDPSHPLAAEETGHVAGEAGGFGDEELLQGRQPVDDAEPDSRNSPGFLTTESSR